MNIGTVWTDIDGVKYEVVDVQTIEREDGSTIENTISKAIEEG